MAEKQVVKFPPLLIVAMVLAVVGCSNVLSAKEVLHAYGIIEVAASLVLLSFFLWKEIGKIFPAADLKKKRTHAGIVIFLSLLLMPLAMILLPWQFYEVYRVHKAIPGSDKNQRGFHVIAALIAFIGAGCVTYLQVTNPVAPPSMQKETPAETVAPPVHLDAPAPPVAE